MVHMLNMGKKNVSIPKDNSPEDITLEIAIDLLSKPKKKK
jgi:topoisomerase IA-like protein